jgi:gamma-glutamylcyclotransferase (GGCT)/AIG2-like uncharacterized protein YtfP
MLSPVSDQLFVYSSLRKGFQQSAYSYITQFFTFKNKAKVKGVLSDLGNQAVATPANGDAFIVGELYELKNNVDFSYAIGQLDGYEGLIAEQDEKPLYRRELTTVFTDDGSAIKAWIYWYNGDVSGMPVISSGDVLEYLESKKH